MTTALDVAGYILDFKPMNAWKIHNLLYLCQLEHIRFYDKPLFTDTMEAWAYGPVIPIVYEKHRKKFVITKEDIGPINPLSENERLVINLILDDYLDRNNVDLRKFIKDEPPFANVYNNRINGCHGEITIESIREYAKEING